VATDNADLCISKILITNKHTEALLTTFNETKWTYSATVSDMRKALEVTLKVTLESSHDIQVIRRETPSRICILKKPLVFCWLWVSKLTKKTALI